MPCHILEAKCVTHLCRQNMCVHSFKSTFVVTHVSNTYKSIYHCKAENMGNMRKPKITRYTGLFKCNTGCKDVFLEIIMLTFVLTPLTNFNPSDDLIHQNL